MKINNLIGNIAAISFVSLLFVFALTWIIFDFNGSSSSLKDTWSIVGSIFGGITTLAAAYIASRLFNDWKEQHNKQVLASEAKENFKLIHLELDCIHELKFTCEDLSQDKSTKHISWHFITTDFENNLVNLFNQNKDKMSSFYSLSEGRDIYTLMENYHSEMGVVAEFLYTKKSQPFSQTTFLNSQMGTEVLLLVQGLEKKNGEVLKELKKYIFVK